MDIVLSRCKDIMTCYLNQIGDLVNYDELQYHLNRWQQLRRRRIKQAELHPNKHNIIMLVNTLTKYAEQCLLQHYIKCMHTHLHTKYNVIL